MKKNISKFAIKPAFIFVLSQIFLSDCCQSIEMVQARVDEVMVGLHC